MDKHVLFADPAAETRTAQMRWEAFCAVMSSWGEADLDYAHEAVAAWGVSCG